MNVFFTVCENNYGNENQLAQRITQPMAIRRVIPVTSTTTNSNDLRVQVVNEAAIDSLLERLRP